MKQKADSERMGEENYRKGYNDQGVRRYLGHVYLFVLFGLTLFTASSYLVGDFLSANIQSPSIGAFYLCTVVFSFIASIVGGLGCLFLSRKRFELKLFCYVLCSLGLGSGSSLLLYSANKVDPSIVWSSAAITGLVVFSLTPLAFFIKRRTVFFLSCIVAAVFVCGFVLGLMNAFKYSQEVDLFLSFLFIFCFSVSFLVYTYTVIEDRKSGKEDVILHAYLLFVSVVNIFVNFVRAKLLMR
ncbi:MAG: uncharacterized protein A8A55_0965 [Amphiamblys sp. WSBS2006]|nr:MAG: uncharacterized protein A8A55_0965 [Amphiamblys sp. WSBS2006]